MDPISITPSMFGSMSSSDGAQGVQGTMSGATAGAATGMSGGGAVATGGNFAQSLTDAIGSVSGLQTNADTAMSTLALGGGTDIHQAMIAMQQASLGMHLAVQVRDKAVESYQTLMNMQM